MRRRESGVHLHANCEMIVHNAKVHQRTVSISRGTRQDLTMSGGVPLTRSWTTAPPSCSRLDLHPRFILSEQVIQSTAIEKTKSFDLRIAVNGSFVIA